MRIPVELILSYLKPGSIIKGDVDGYGPHFYIILNTPLIDNFVIACLGTSQIRKRIEAFGEDSIFIINESEVSVFTKQTAFCYENIKEYDLSGVKNGLESENYTYEIEGVPEIVLSRFITAIHASDDVDRNLKLKIKNNKKF